MSKPVKQLVDPRRASGLATESDLIAEVIRHHFGIYLAQIRSTNAEGSPRSVTRAFEPYASVHTKMHP